MPLIVLSVIRTGSAVAMVTSAFPPWDLQHPEYVPALGILMGLAQSEVGAGRRCVTTTTTASRAIISTAGRPYHIQARPVLRNDAPPGATGGGDVPADAPGSPPACLLYTSPSP